jgi:hypothetical protein
MRIANIDKIQSQIKNTIGPKWKEIIKGGLHDGAVASQPYLESRMQYYMHDRVYDAYVPSAYERTNRLMESVESTVEDNDSGSAIRVYSNGHKLLSYTLKHPPAYNYYVLVGKYDWDIPKPIGPRDWITPMKKEFKNHAKQEGVLMDNIKKAVVKRWREG